MRLPLLPLLVLTASACKAHTNGSEAPAAAVDEPAPAPEPMAGGFQAREAGDPEVVTAAEEAVRLLQAKEGDPSIALVKVRSAEAQVVAGMNYRLDLDLGTAAGEKAVRVVVFRALDGQYSLTASEPIE